MQNNNSVKINHRKMQASTAMSRRYAKRPASSQLLSASDTMMSVKRSSKIQHFNAPAVRPIPVTPPEDPIAPPLAHPLQESANLRLRERMNPSREHMSSSSQPRTPRITAKQLKDQAIQKALASATSIETSESAPMSTAITASSKSKKSKNQIHFGIGRIALATVCAAAAVFAIVYFVNLNMPDISMRVAAMQTGMNPTYPNYVPRDFNISSITAEDNKITMDFVNNSTDASFTLIEEKSSWDSNSLLSNYVKNEYGEDYNIIKEQGLTIYVNNSNATWVNGGIFYRIEAQANALTNKQIRAIAASL